MAGAARHRRRARHRADRRRRLWSTRAPNGCTASGRRLSPIAPPGARWCRPTQVPARIPRAAVHLWLGRDAHLVHYPVQGRHAHQHRRHRARRMAREPAGRRPATRAEICAHFARWTWCEPARDLIAHAGALAEMGALSTGAAPFRGGERPGDADRGRRPPDAAVPRARRGHGDRGCRGARRHAGALRATIRPTRCAPTKARAAHAHRAGATRRAQQGRIYELSGPEALRAQSVMRVLGGEMLLRALRLALWLASRPQRCRCRRAATSHDVSDHHRRQPAEAVLARRAQQAVAAMAARGRRARAGQARRHAARDQAAGGRRHRHRQRRRAVAPAFRARLSRIRRRHRLRQQGRDGHPQRPLQSDGADGARRAEAQGPRARTEARHARAHTKRQAQVHAARADDDRRHHRRPPLRRPGEDGDGLRRPAQPGSARARAGRRRRHPVRRAGLQRLHGRGRRPGASRRCERAIAGLNCTTAVHICYGYGIKANIDWKNDARRASGGSTRRSSRRWPQAASTRSRSSASTRTCRWSCCRCSKARTCWSASSTSPPTRSRRRRRSRDVIGDVIKYVPKERIVACTNCGMAPMRRDIAEAKLEALGAGAALARQRFA